MRVIRKDGMYHGTFVSGPGSAYLGLKLVHGPASELVLSVRDLRGFASESGERSIDQVRLAIEQGIEHAHNERGANVHAEYAQIVGEDPCAPEVYRDLALGMALDFIGEG